MWVSSIFLFYKILFRIFWHSYFRFNVVIGFALLFCLCFHFLLALINRHNTCCWQPLVEYDFYVVVIVSISFFFFIFVCFVLLSLLCLYNLAGCLGMPKCLNEEQACVKFNAAKNIEIWRFNLKLYGYFSFVMKHSHLKRFLTFSFMYNNKLEN